MLTKKQIHCILSPPPLHYEILIGQNLVEEAIAWAKTISNQCLIITTDCVNTLLPTLEMNKLVLPPGEIIKSRAIKEKIEDALIERGWGRECCLVAIGGGAILDLVGFVAATYCRGITYISVPTTLIAMTDAAIGGKTGVNVQEAKNWIGAFHHPKKIFIDLSLLNTLPEREYLYGLSETIKHGLIADQELFFLLESTADRILRREAPLLAELVYKSCLIKKEIVEKDPFEKDGYRRILNFGHTIAHAIETFSEYRIAHGQAVIMGLRVEAALSYQMGYLPRPAYERIQALLRRYPFKMDLPKQLPYDLLRRDKKGAYRMVVLTGIGKVAPFDGEYTTSISKRDLEKGWVHALCDDQVLV